jgi:hypothetical protein
VFLPLLKKFSLNSKQILILTFNFNPKKFYQKLPQKHLFFLGNHREMHSKRRQVWGPHINQTARQFHMCFSLAFNRIPRFSGANFFVNLN